MEHSGEMSVIRLPILVFLLVFLGGTGIVLWQRMPSKPQKPRPQVRRTEAVNRKLPPLKLPGHESGKPGSESWEFSGEIQTNFVTARAKFNAELMHQGWRPEKQIVLDESISPRTLLTFHRGELELILMLWKIDTDTTGFAYRREKIITSGVVAQ